MKIIKNLVEHIKEEVEGAKDYAEKYVEFKAKGNLPIANQYKEMSNDELKHAMFFHEQAVKEIESLSKIYTPPTNMLEKWEHEHKEYVESVGLIRQILGM